MSRPTLDDVRLATQALLKMALDCATDTPRQARDMCDFGQNLHDLMDDYLPASVPAAEWRDQGMVAAQERHDAMRGAA